MTTNIDHFNQIECEKIDAECVNAFVDFHLDPDNPTGLCLDSSWGGECLDITNIVKEAETCTSLYLSPQPDPNCLVYEGECDTYCIDGDDLSRIISMTKLKDVDQSVAPQNGDVYMFDGNKFVPFNLGDFVSNYNNTIANLNAQINQILNKLTPPEGAPQDANLTWGNINLYSDHNAVIDANGNVTSLDKSSGLYSHKLSINRHEDEIMG